MKVEIIRYKPFDGATLKGFIDVSIDCGDAKLQVNGIRIIAKRTGGYFYAMPSREQETPAGEKEYFPICGFFVKGDYVVFHNAVDAAFKEYTPTEKPKPVEPAPWSTAQDDFADKNKYNADTADTDDGLPF